MQHFFVLCFLKQDSQISGFHDDPVVIVGVLVFQRDYSRRYWLAPREHSRLFPVAIRLAGIADPGSGSDHSDIAY